MDHGKEIIYFETFDLKETILFFYEKESENWHRNIHKRKGSLEENVQSTFNTISPTSKMYKVLCNGECAAFFVKFIDGSNGVLEGFHIGHKFRTKDFLEKFWTLVKNEFIDANLYCGLHDKNEPAINHLIKQGFKKNNDFVSDGINYVILGLEYH